MTGLNSLRELSRENIRKLGQQPKAPPPPPTPAPAPVPAPPPALPPAPKEIEIVVPPIMDWIQPKMDAFMYTTDDGTQIEIPIPPNVGPGATLIVELSSDDASPVEKAPEKSIFWQPKYDSLGRPDVPPGPNPFAPPFALSPALPTPQIVPQEEQELASEDSYQYLASSSGEGGEEVEGPSSYIPATPSPGPDYMPATPSPDYTKAPPIPSTSEEEEEPVEDSNLLTTIEHTEEEEKGEKSDIKKIN